MQRPTGFDLIEDRPRNRRIREEETGGGRRDARRSRWQRARVRRVLGGGEVNVRESAGALAQTKKERADVIVGGDEGAVVSRLRSEHASSRRLRREHFVKREVVIAIVENRHPSGQKQPPFAAVANGEVGESASAGRFQRKRNAGERSQVMPQSPGRLRQRQARKLRGEGGARAV